MPMSLSERHDTYAAIDLGSNSFHLLVARKSHGELRVLDRIKETVRLGGGLDQDGRLDDVTRANALTCLARFGQRLRGIPPRNMRAVGTQTFRRLRNANVFLVTAETELGCPIEIIAGREEARLIYLGVSEGVAGHEERRLVMDIGGGSTELVIGQDQETLQLESMQFGCVTLTQWHFPDGRINENRWNKAHRAVRAELQEIQNRYRKTGWNLAIGSSGTIRAIETVCKNRGWTEKNISWRALQLMKQELIGYRDIDSIAFPGMSDRRRSVIAGGLVVLSACFEALDLDELLVSPFALREGVLHDLLGRQEHRDPRDKTVEAFKSRYSVDQGQLDRVSGTVNQVYEQLAAQLQLSETHRELLSWAADLHEVGLSISHSHYQNHSGYLVAYSDMAGFSQQEQQFLASLVRCHRRDIPPEFANDLPPRLRDPLCKALFILRFAWILNRTRDTGAVPVFQLSGSEDSITASFDQKWVDDHPLTMADLEQEVVQLKTLGIDLKVDNPDLRVAQ